MRRLLTVAVMVTSFAVAGQIAHAQPDKALASTDTQWPGVRAELLEVARMPDGMVRVRWRWINTENQKVGLLDRNQYGVALRKDTYLIDGANRKKHMVVMDSSKKLVAAPTPDVVYGVVLKPKASIVLWAKFPAPPADVQRIGVVLAKTTPFEDVAIAPVKGGQ